MNGPAEVKDHAWFKNFDWKVLESKVGKGPFDIPKGDIFDEKYVNSDWKDNDPESMR